MTLAVIMIVLLIVLIIGWVWITVHGAYNNANDAPFYWTFLPIGSIFLLTILAGVITYLVLAIKAINLNQRQANFIDSVTHELKSPIASLKLFLQTLNRRSVSEAEKSKFYGTMLDDVERLDHLINHLLDAGRLDKERDDAEVEEIRLDKLLESCAEATTLLYRIPESVVTLELQPCVLQSCRGDLDILFRNLIDNAVKYSGTDAQVEVGLSIDAQQVATIRITDNGPGIPEQMRRKIFGRFFRLGMELQRKKPGTGLGLYIVRTLVRRLRGTITVLDAPSGTGTMFVVTLPQVQLTTDQLNSNHQASNVNRSKEQPS
ncbi:MAG: two-component sensor histidine kinase [Blastopirellula sp.]|nr:MAG: two-component sensor histidine kinase [Blastopirellula sp.]